MANLYRSMRLFVFFGGKEGWHVRAGGGLRLHLERVVRSVSVEDKARHRRRGAAADHNGTDVTPDTHTPVRGTRVARKSWEHHYMHWTRATVEAIFVLFC